MTGNYELIGTFIAIIKSARDIRFSCLNALQSIFAGQN